MNSLARGLDSRRPRWTGGVNLQSRMPQNIASTPSPPDRTETAVAVLIFLTYACGILRLLFNDESTAGAAAYRATTTAFYVFTIILLIPLRAELWRLMLRAPFLALLCVLPLISTLWSTSPNDTLTRSIMLIGSSMFGYYLAIRFNEKQLIRLLCVTAVIVAALSVVLIVAVPSMGVHGDKPWTGTWRGAYTHKNSLGPAMALNAALLALYILNGPRQTEGWAWAGLGLCFGLVIAAKSVTGLIVLLTGFGVLVLIRVCGQHIKAAFAPTALVLLPVIGALTFFVFNNGIIEVITSLGRDITFSGRIPIWTALWPFITKNFWFGYGYEAFWVKSQIGVRVIEETLHFRPFYAHNGILELFLSLGLFGVVLFCALFLTFLRRLVRHVGQSTSSTLGNMTALFTLSFVMANFSEVVILVRNEALWCLFITFYFKLAMFQDERRPTVKVQNHHQPGMSGR
jgi:exopolysaccharide production protein ExoQ